MFYTIYLHQNKLNNKVYVGQTLQNPPELRWKSVEKYKTCKYFYHSVKKYGWENFNHIILEQGELNTQEEIDQREIYFIQKYNATNPKYGYNLTNGGSNISPNASEGYVKWLKEHPEFGLARASDMLKWQKEHPEEALAMRRTNAKKASDARKRKVICIETQTIYESASEAARQIEKTSQSKICMCCQGKRNTCGGYHWKYYEE